MKILKMMVASVFVLSVLSTSGCMLFDPWWWGGPHGGDGGPRGGDGGPHGGGPR